MSWVVVTARPDGRRGRGKKAHGVDQRGDEPSVCAAKIVPMGLADVHLHHRVPLADLGEVDVERAKERNAVARLDGGELHVPFVARGHGRCKRSRSPPAEVEGAPHGIARSVALPDTEWASAVGNPGNTVAGRLAALLTRIKTTCGNW